MAFQFPANRTHWVCNQNNSRLPDIVATRNISFDEEGVVRLSKRSVSIYDTANDADWDNVVGFHLSSGGDYYAATTDETFIINIGGGATNITATQDVSAGVADSSTDGSSCHFNAVWVVTEDNDIHTLSGSTWTDTAITLTSGKKHPCCNFKSKNWLAVGDGNAVNTYNTSLVAQTTCTIPVGEEIISIAYNSGYVAFTTLNEDENGSFYVWDGNQAAANYSYTLGSHKGFFTVPYKNTFVVLNALGQLLYWTPSGLLPLAALPVYYTKGHIDDYRSVVSVIQHENAATVVGDNILFNLGSDLEFATEYNINLLPEMPGGIWCYDPVAGLHHKYSQSNAKMIENEFSYATDVNTTTNQITVTTAPETGTPAIYSNGSGDNITPLKNGELYYIIKVDATTVKLATTRTNALAGTAIDLTGTGTSANQFLWAFPENDFGQYETGNAGAIQTISQHNADNTPAREIMFSAKCQPSQATNLSDLESLNIVVDKVPNRGHFVLAKMFANGLSDDWQKVLVRARTLVTEEDKIVVKVKTQDTLPVTSYSLYPTVTSDYGIWTDTDTFTTALDLSTVEVGDEVMILAGCGAGYTAHISSLSLNAGTWTVNLDEAILGTTATYWMEFSVDKFKKLSTITNQSVTNEDGYFDVPINKKARWCQVKVEMRGTNITVDDIILLNAPHKPVA